MNLTTFLTVLCSPGDGYLTVWKDGQRSFRTAARPEKEEYSRI